MSIKYTPEQEEAIFTQNKTLLLSAAAGGGKTAVLVQRIIEMISDENNDTDIGDLLVVTFTKLAASQMKDRIRKALSEKLAQNPTSKKIKKQLLNISCADIQTIHGFCLNLIKSNINRADIPVNFRVADENTVKSVKQRAFEELFEEKYACGDKNFARFLDSYVYTSGEEGLIKLISSVYDMANSMAEPDKFYDMCLDNIKNAGENFENSAYYEILLSHCRDILKNNVKKYENILELASECDKNGKNRDFFYEEYSLMKKLLDEPDVFYVTECLKERKSLRKPNGVGDAGKIVSAVRGGFKKDVEILEKYFCCDVSEEEENQKKIYPFAETLISLTKEFSDKFSELKKKKAMLDFSDFEHLAFKILKNEDGTPSDTAIGCQKKYREILIDEYQDTSDIQNAIFSCVSRNEKNLFMVGDVKQCIYKFRQARPEIFAKKESFYSQNTEDGRLILLSHNFRSRKEILNSVNDIFIPIMNTETGITDYKAQLLVCGGNFSYNEKCGYKTAVMLFDKSDKNIPEKYEGLNGEAIMLAQKIKELTEGNEELICENEEKGLFRKCNYSDIVILTRNMTGTARKIYDALVNFGIPVTADFSDNMFEQPEILMIMNALKCIDNPRDDFALLSFLKSPVWRFSENELLQIRKLSKNTPFFEALLKSESKKAKEFLHTLKLLESFAFSNDVSKTVQKIYDDLELYQRFSSFKNPEGRILNLDEFYSLSLEYDKTENGGLKGFIFYIDKISQNPKNVTDLKGGATQSVRIMTMHKSKGLEFPVVFVSGLAKSFSAEELKGNILINADIGIGADVMARDNRASFGTLARSAVKCKIINDTIGEEMRLLYVALTRARDKLFITAECSNTDKNFSIWDSVNKSGGFTKNYLYTNRNFMSWIMPTVINNDNFDLFEYDYGSLRIEPTLFDREESTQTDSGELFVFEEYQNTERTALPAKITVSQANKVQNGEENIFGVTLDELEDVNDKYGGSEYGTYFHRMFELLDFSRIKKGEAVGEILRELLEKNIMEECSYTAEAVSQTEAFFKTDVAKEMLEADEVFREKPFLVRIEACRALETQSRDEILLQGTSDCYFVKNNEITLIDFKTNKNTDENHIRSEYKKQMELYAYAIEKVTGKKVAKKIIYTARNGKTVDF